ncbi:MAG: hypothetical protein KGR98_06900 [Verrucomicrobia bacterium]|nr:hypothetical protein [Verrucomicrobiota bacterium]MDE3099482.1 hypothetical protein [Verrucomicrobiota bacterium]
MKAHTILLIIPILLCGCAATRPLSDAAFGAGGGALAAQFSNGNPGITAAGAAGGVLASEGLHYAAGREKKAAYQNGYDKGRSDAVKQQYWLMVSRQKGVNQSGVRYYYIQVPEQIVDGVILEPTTEYIPVEQ